MTDRMSGATEQEQEEIRREMNAALNLCPPSRFMQSIEALKKVTFSQSAFSEAELSAQGKKFAQIHFHTIPQPPVNKQFELLKQTVEDFSACRSYA